MQFKCDGMKRSRACLISMSEVGSGDDEMKIIARRARAVGAFNHRQHSVHAKCANSR